MSKKIMPWALIIGGFYSLAKLPAIIAGGIMVIGIVMLIERVWPEQWGESEKI